MKHIFIGFVFFIIASMFSCKKETVLAIGEISGPSAVCVGEQEVIYSVEMGAQVNQAIWTVPEGAQIMSGQGSGSIRVNFGRKQGKICVRFYNEGEPVSAISCIDITFGVPGKWCRVTDFGGGERQGAIGFAVGGKGYVGTGLSGNLKQKDFWEFDPVNNIWTKKNDFIGFARDQAVAFSIGGKAYFGTGYMDIFGSLKDFWEYDPVADLWQQKADLIGGVRQYAFAFTIGNKGYLGGGTGSELYTDFYEYNYETNEWVKKANVPVVRVGAAGFSIGNNGYIAMGSSDGGSVFENDFWKFDPTDASDGLDSNNNPLGKWTQKQNIPAPVRYGAVGFSIGNKGYVGGGAGAVFYDDFWEYDPAIDTGWVEKESTIGTRGFAVGFSIDNKGYIGTGSNSSSQKKSDFWIYTQ